MPHLRAIADGRARLEFLHRPGRAHARAGAGTWAAVLMDGRSGGGLTLEVGDDADDLRERLGGRLAALAERDALEALGIPACRYAGLMECVRESAARLGIDVAAIPGIEFVREWMEHSEGMAAGWMAFDGPAVDGAVARVAERLSASAEPCAPGL